MIEYSTHTAKEIYIEWNGLRAKVVESNIFGLNGVIHVIDRVLAIRRDFTVTSGSLGLTASSWSVMMVVGTLLAALVARY